MYTLLRALPVTALAAIAATVTNAAAQPYPTKPVRGIVGFAAGGQIDVIARLVANKVSERWGQQLIIENRPGAGSNIASEVVAKAAPDGYTVLFATQSVAINSVLLPSAAFNPVKDFAPVTLLASAEAALFVPPSLPVQSLQELIAWTKANPGQMYASTSLGSVAHIGMELLKSQTGLRADYVLYNNISQAISDVTSGRVPIWLTLLSPTMPQIKAGKLRTLAVTGAKRQQALPDVPTFKEAGQPNFEATSWYAIYAPAGTPGAVIARINTDVRSALQAGDLRERMGGLGIEPTPSTPEFLASYQNEEIERIRMLVKSGAVKIN